MRILHRLAKRERERKGHGLNGDPPMPADPGSARDDGFSGPSDADRELLEQAARTFGTTGPAARSRGLELAAEIRGHGGSLEQWLPVLHRLEWAVEHGGDGGAWKHVRDSLRVACHELHTGGATRETPPQAEDCGCRWLMPRTPGDDPAWVPCDAHADRLLGLVQDGGAR